MASLGISFSAEASFPYKGTLPGTCQNKNKKWGKRYKEEEGRDLSCTKIFWKYMQIGTCCHPNTKEEGDKMEREKVRKWREKKWESGEWRSENRVSEEFRKKLVPRVGEIQDIKMNTQRCVKVWMCESEVGYNFTPHELFAVHRRMPVNRGGWEEHVFFCGWDKRCTLKKDTGYYVSDWI